MTWNTLASRTARHGKPAYGVAAVAMAAFALMPAPGHGAGLSPAHLRGAAAMRPVHVHAVRSHPVKGPAMRKWRRPAVSWPAAGSATAAPAWAAGSAPAQRATTAAGRNRAAKTRPGNVAMARPSTGSARAGSLPVWVGPAVGAPGTGSSAPAMTGQVRVAVAARAAAKAAGISGLIFTVARGGPSGPGASGPAEPVHVSLDYKSFAYADGGGFAARLHLVQLPACALTTPAVPSCRRQTPLASGNDVTTSRLGTDVTLPSGAAAGGTGLVVLAATTSASGSAGDYSATPLSEAGTWSAGGTSGAFTYSYPITLPPVPGGLAPQVSLDYNSQAVDGLTSSTNDQASWIGDGWNYQPGYIERGYQSCEQTSAKTGDLCWSSNNTTMLSLGGVTTTLVDDPSKGWHAEADNGEKVSYLARGTQNCSAGETNGTYDGGYWVVTDADGTSYYFGMNQLPGYASGDATTSSTWTAPVYAATSGQPCYNSTFASSHGMQAWRWNLDYVTDSHGDAVALFYNTETNYYAADNGTKATASYTQGGALSKIEYGLRAGAVYGATPAAQVNFTTATDRTDVPTGSSADLACSSGATCDVVSPTFWIKYRLSTIATEALKGSALQPVDSWALAQDYPATGDGSSAPPMWLQSITRTGEDGSTHLTLPPVKFTGISLANRVETQQDLNDGYSIINRFRVSQVTSETGGVTSVTYDTPPSSCTSGNFPVEDANGTVCYPDYWTPPGASSPVEDWFNKYVVTAVTQANTVGGTVPVTTTYCYGAAPGCLSSGAWHYDDDALTRSKNRTWDQWRGFRTVTTETGTAPDPITKTVDTYFQGMDGDYQSGGGTGSASLSTTVNGKTITVTDSDQFAGMSFEHVAYNGSAGNVVTDTVTTPWTSAVTASQSQPSPLPSLQGFMTGVAETQAFTALTAGGYRESDETYHHDSYGRIDWQADVPDTGDASEDTCTQTTYAGTTSSWSSTNLTDLPSEQIVTSVAPSSCPVSGTPTQAELVSDTRTFYDGSSTLGAAPSAGDATMTQAATSYSGGSPVFTTESKTSVDEYGRTTSSTDADGNATTTAYTPATGAEPTSVQVTKPLTLVTTTTYDPARDLPLTVTNPAGWVTTEAYDSLGRLTSVWTPGHATSGPADKTFSYNVSATAPSVVTTSTINTAGTYLTSDTLYDSLGRQIETQTQTPDGNRTITDTYYNSDGWKQITSSPYYTTGAPSGTLVAAPDDQVPQQTGYVYDGAGRVLRTITYSYASELWETDTAYGGNYTTVTPPSGGTAETTYTNGLGKTSYIYQYHSATPPSSPPAAGSGSQSGSSGWDQTAYTYTPNAQLATITDAAGHKWSNTYDLAGNEVSSADPDSGTTTSTYDAVGNLLSTTDSRAKTISYGYDADNRKIRECDGAACPSTATTTLLAAWTYDTLAKGQLTSSVSYPTGTTGTSYTEKVAGYNTYGLPTGSLLTVSSGALAGTYRQSIYYSSYGDIQTSYYDYAAGGLPAETVGYTYDTADQPISMTSSLWDYVSALSYTELGQPQEYAMGTTTEPAWLTNNWDLSTGRLDSAGVQAGVSPVTVDNIGYTYNNTGNVTAESDNPAGAVQDQCFQYDYLGRLTQAWSQGSAGCSAGPSQAAEAAAAAPYWNQYSYNNENDLTQVTSTPVSGQSTTYANAYPATTGADGPHAIASQQISGGSSGSTSFSYDAAGHLTGQSGSAGSQTLSWNDLGQLSSDTTSGGTTGYVYDADGNLLLQSDPGSVTLYLSDEQLTENTSTGTVTGVRYYSVGGQTVAARTSAGDVQYLIGNQQGTAMTAIDYQSLAVTRRYYDPFGNEIGRAAQSWPGTRGFVGGTADPATGLTNLGAREYNPADAAFISPDPLVDPYNPQDLNAYAYATDSPVAFADPSGAMPCIAGGPCGSFQYLEHWSSHQSNTYNSGRTAPYAPYSPTYYGPANDVHIPLFEAPPPPVVVRSPRVIAPHQGGPSSPGSYNPYECGRFGLNCSGAAQYNAYQKAHESSGGNPFTALWHGVVRVGKWAWNNRGTLASIGANILCLIPATAGGCVAWQAIAYGVRVEQRIQTYGFKKSLDANLADTVMTVGFTAPMAGAMMTGTAAMSRTAQVVLGSVASIPDYVNFIGGEVPGHDPVFFNGGTFNW